MTTCSKCGWEGSFGDGHPCKYENCRRQCGVCGSIGLSDQVYCDTPGCIRATGGKEFNYYRLKIPVEGEPLSQLSDALAGPDDKDGMRLLTPNVPEKCLVCGASYLGGHQLPGLRMKPGLRVFYSCGSSLSIYKDLGYGSYHLLVKNCWCPENVKICKEFPDGQRM